MALLYPELPPGEFIRVLDLHPGSNDEELAGELRTCELGKSPYIALSYVCGNSTLTHSILVSGHKLGIYKNASELLTRFRDATEIVTVWIDGVCINQRDTAEKEREVAFMYKIYETAVCCNIWLGPGNEDSRLAMKYASTLGDAYPKEFCSILAPAAVLDNLVWERKSHILDVLNDHPAKETLVNACANFLLRPWFTRVWCSQEGAVSVNTFVYCGSEVLSWIKIFALAWLFLPRWTISWPDWFMKDYDLLEPNLMNALNIQRYRLRRTFVEDGKVFGPSSSLVSVLQTSAWRQQCYDPRDKIYAMRNIASDLKGGDDWAPKPDYSISWRELYTNLAVALVNRNEKDVLRLSGTLRQGQDAALHSYVPDWRAYPRIQYILHTEWCAGTKSALHTKLNRIPKKRQGRLLNLFPQDSSAVRTLQYTMSVSTLMQDEILYLGGVVPRWEKHSDSIRTFHRDVLAVDEASMKQLNTLDTEDYISSEPLIEAYNTTLIAKTTDKDALASPSYISDGISAWRAWLKDGADLTNVPTFHEAIDNMDTFREKRFCITKGGYFCLVPASVKPTDIIAIVKGLDMPLLLRPIDTCYIYVGECYVHGMMELQAATLIEEFSIRIRDGKPIWKPEGDVRRNGLSLDVGEYKRILGTLGERSVELI